TTVAISLVLHLVESLTRGFENNRRPWFVPISALAASIMIFGVNVTAMYGWHRIADRPSGSLAHSIDEMVSVVDRHAKNEAFLAISTHPFPGFPTALYAQAEWAGRTNSQILLPAIVKMHAHGIPDSDPRLSSIEQTARAMFREDLETRTPAVVLIDARPHRYSIDDLQFDFLEFYLADPDIRRIWSEYAEIPPVGGF